MALTTIKMHCIDQTLQISSKPTIASGGKDEVKIEFTFCELWSGFFKVAVFYRDKGKPYFMPLDEAGTCIVPWEVLTTDGALTIGVFGVDAHNVLRTSATVSYKIAEGALTDEVAPQDPTPEMWEQILALVAATEGVTEARAAELFNIHNATPDAHSGLLIAHNIDEEAHAGIFVKGLVELQATLNTSAWAADAAGGYSQTVAVADLLATDAPIVDVLLDSNTDTNTARLEAYACITRVTALDGSVKVYADSAAPTTAITLRLGVMR